MIAPDAARISEVLDQLQARTDAEDDDVRAVVRAGGALALRKAAGRFVLPVGADVGRFLNLLVRCLGATRILEIGASVGYSTIWLAEAARHTGGTVDSIECDAAKVAEQLDNLEAAGLAGVVRQLAGASEAVLPTLAGPYDLVLVDHWKQHYVRDFDLVWPKVGPRGVVVADNILSPPFTGDEADAYVRHTRARRDAWSFTLPIGDGVEITQRL